MPEQKVRVEYVKVCQHVNEELDLVCRQPAKLNSDCCEYHTSVDLVD